MIRKTFSFWSLVFFMSALAHSSFAQMNVIPTVEDIKAGLAMELQEMEGLHCHSYFAEWKTRVPELDLDITRTWQKQLSELVSGSSEVESIPEERLLVFTSTPESGILKGFVAKVHVEVDKLGTSIQRLGLEVFEPTRVNVGTLFKPQFTTELKIQRQLKCNWNYRK